jgi:hypothetical protein
MVRTYLKKRARPIPPNLVLGMLLVLLAALAGWVARARFYAPAEVTDFESCVKAGNPVIDISPEQCVHEGQSYINTPENKLNR